MLQEYAQFISIVRLWDELRVGLYVHKTTPERLYYTYVISSSFISIKALFD